MVTHCPTCGRKATRESRLYRAVRDAARAGADVAGLCKAAGMAPTAVVNAARVLREAGLIVRYPPRDGRWYAAGMEPPPVPPAPARLGRRGAAVDRAEVGA